MSRPVKAMRTLAAALWAGGAMACGPVQALDLRFPGPAESTASRSEALASIRLPIGPYAAGSLPTQLAEGALDQMAFRISLSQPSTLELLQSLRDQVAAAGYEVLFECETDACGGYDFRYGTEILPEPEMHVDLGDFRYLAARRGGSDKVEYLALIVSRSSQDGFVQVTRVGKAGQVARDAIATTLSASSKSPDLTAGKATALASAKPGQSVPGLAELGNRLELGQSQVLEDLVFASGSSSLAAGDYVSLAVLADWLKANDQRKVTLVGHTDASGGLAGNIRLSQLRAESVRQFLLFTHKVAPAQVQAEGVGYLAPRDSNQTEEGRHRNRRVEVIATSTELLAP